MTVDNGWVEESYVHEFVEEGSVVGVCSCEIWMVARLGLWSRDGMWPASTGSFGHIPRWKIMKV